MAWAAATFRENEHALEVNVVLAEPWHQLLLMFGVALASSVAALLIRCQEVGRPFGTRASTARAAIVLVAVAGVAATVSVFGRYVPAVSTAPPVLIALVLPVTLCIGRALSRQQPDGLARGTSNTSQLVVLATVGIVTLLAWLDDRMNMDRDDWSEAVEGWEMWPTHVLATESRRLVSVLERLVENNQARAGKVQAAGLKVTHNIRILNNPRAKADQQDQALHDAQRAYLMLRACIYVWGYRRRIEPARQLRFWPWRRRRPGLERGY